MAMQPRAWMTSYLFSAWISHFIASIRRHSVISPEHRHLLILDGHNSHVTLEVARLAKNVGLDLITLPSHTSHALQPLDVSVFKPFKQYFREYRDYWTSRNRDQSATKEVLAQWVSLGLRKALSVCNISSGFRRTGIYPLNSQAVDAHLTPSEVYRSHGRLDPADAPSSMEEAVIGDQEEETGDNQQTDGVEEGHDVPSGPAALYPLASSDRTSRQTSAANHKQVQNISLSVPTRLGRLSTATLLLWTRKLQCRSQSRSSCSCPGSLQVQVHTVGIQSWISLNL